MEGSPSDRALPDAKRPRRSEGLPVLTNTAHIVECEQGNSTSLQVTVAAQDSHMQYQWLRDDQAIAEGFEGVYSDVTSPVLKVGPVNLSMEKYTFSCKVTNSEGTVESEPIQLQIESPLDQYADVVKSKNAILPARKQNVLVKKCVSVEDIEFNLALIQKKKIRFDKESTCYTLHGFNDVMKEKLSIEYEEVFNDLEVGAKVLLLGRPGSGKSTLSQRIATDWAKSGLKIGTARFVFPISLRACLKNSEFDLSNILERYFDKDSAAFCECSKCISDGDGEGVCFLLDGLEDHSMSKKFKDTFLCKLLRGETLGKSVVVITSKPSSAVKLPLRTHMRQVEILGLSNTQIHEYVRSYPFSKRNRASKLSSFLEDHPNVMSMCYLPYQLEIIAHLYDELENKLPCTITKIYEAYCTRVLRQASRKGVRQRRNFKSFGDLLPHEAEVFGKLCKLAYVKITSTERVLQSNQLAKLFGDDSTYLGLLSQDAYSAHHGNPDVFTFLNPTLQQYLAALHITSLPDAEQTKVIKKLSTNNKHLEPVIAFYFGSVAPDNIEGQLESVIKSTTKDKTAFHVQCVFEAQKPSLCDKLTNRNHKHLKISGFLPPTNTTALAYVLGCNTSSSIAITMHGVVMGLDGTKAFVREAERRGIAGVEKFFFLLRHCCEHTMECVLPVLKQLVTCREVCFSRTRLNVGLMKILTRDIDLLKRMVSIDVSECNLRCTATKLFLNGIKHSNNLKVLRMNDNDMDQACMTALAKFLTEYNDLSELNIENCTYYGIIHDEEGLQLTESLKHSTHLKVLKIGLNTLGLQGCKVLAESLRHCRMLEELDMRSNPIKDEGVAMLMRALKNCTTLRCLDLSGCMGNDGVKAVANSLAILD